jgi:hypothetical protein
MPQTQLTWSDLSRRQQIEMVAVIIFTLGSALFVLKPGLARLHPMFAGELTTSRAEFLFSPSGIAIIVYCVVILLAYSYVCYREYW